MGKEGKATGGEEKKGRRRDGMGTEGKEGEGRGRKGEGKDGKGREKEGSKETPQIFTWIDAYLHVNMVCVKDAGGSFPDEVVIRG